MDKGFLFIGLFFSFLLISCGSPNRRSEKAIHSEINKPILTGEQLAFKYCQSCHLYPDPSILDKFTWKRSVLPLMGRLFGIYEDIVPRSQIINGAINKKSVLEMNIFPSQQTISDADWGKIIEFYLSNAPEPNPSNLRKDSLFVGLKEFEIIFPPVKNEAIQTSLIKIDAKTSNIYVGESKGKLGLLKVFNNKFETLHELPLPSPPTDVSIRKDTLAITLSGSFRLNASNNPFGEFIYIFRKPGEENYTAYSKFLNELNRPVQTVFEDVNGDGFEDILIAEFGYYTGSLTWYENSGDSRKMYKKNVLKNVAGAVRTYVRDMDGDGDKDIISLFAQGDEGISIFFNNGQGEFTEERVLRFNPSYGSVYFELVDFNKDGFPDILYCNGDNGDYPPVLKNYHGIRIFENDASNNFKQVYFFPMYGAFKCSAADFDLDGDLDLIGISHFPDFQSEKRQDLVYLENKNDYSFSSQYLDRDIPARWITFDIGDLDGNGYLDIVLGGLGTYQKDNSIIIDNQVNTSLLLLKNLGKK